jgi:hypothetical protein
VVKVLPYFPAASAVFAFAQAEAFKHCTTPSITNPIPDRNFSGSTISRAATASVIANAFCRNVIAAPFFSAPDLFPNRPSMPLTNAGTKAIPRNS